MDEHSILCPYCGENIGILVDCSVEEQQYYEDCSVCCSPILFEVINSNSAKAGTQITVKRDDD